MSNGDLVDYVFVIELPEDKAEIARLEAHAAKPPVSLFRPACRPICLIEASH